MRTKVNRLNLKEATYFVTTVTQDRKPIFADSDNITLLRQVMRNVQQHHPFVMKAYVFLPEHFHFMAELGKSADISKLMQSIKRNFTRAYKAQHNIQGSIKIWQRSFHDHVIRDDKDFINHVNYIHYNPVKHGLVTCPEMYEHSSFQTFLQKGWYEIGWGHQDDPTDGKLTEWGE